MKTYRVLAELTELYEIVVEANNAQEALEKARDAGQYEFEPFTDRPYENDFNIIEDSVEEYSE